MSSGSAAVAREAERVLGDYQFVRTIACGGMATLLLARKSGPAGYGHSVALKVMHPHLALRRELVEMFATEARLGACINHPNVCRVFDFDRLSDTYFIALEYVRGETLGALLDVIAGRADLHPLRVALGVRVLAQACEGLHAIHEALDSDGNALDIVHCDVAPDNLMIGYDGNVHVVDLGVASVGGAAAPPGPLRGRPAYAAPEHVRRLALDRRADVWSLGVILQEALTGEHPLARNSPAATLRAVLRGARRAWPAHVPPALRAIADRALALDRAERFASARALGEALTDYLAVAGGAGVDVAAVMHELFVENIAHKDQVLHQLAVETRRRAAPIDTVVSKSALRLKRFEGAALGTRAYFFRRLLLGAGVLALALTLNLRRSPAREAEPVLPARAAEAAPPARDPEPARSVRTTQPATPTPTGAEAPGAEDPAAARIVQRSSRSARPRADRAAAQTPAKTARAAAFGTLVLGGAQGWAVVYEGGKRLGTTPLRVKLRSGMHTLQIRPYGEGAARPLVIHVRAAETVRRVVAP
jgi:hypothetical protein